MTCTEVAEGPTHAFTDLPMLLFGEAQGAGSTRLSPPPGGAASGSFAAG